MWLKRALLWLLVLTFSWAAFKITDDSALYKIQWKGYSEIPKNLLKDTEGHILDLPVVHISTSDNEPYLCTMPIESSEDQNKLEKYTGPSPGELINTLYTSRMCSYWLDVYWTYELCHGRYLLQYHEDKDFVRRSKNEYYLGNYQREQSKLDDKEFDQLNPPKRKINNKAVPYYPVTYRQGTVCDITGKPRSTVVIYVCKPDANDQIHTFTEVASCVYEMVILTKLLCSHPAFQPPAPVESNIICYAKNAAQKNAKPKRLLEMEKEEKHAVEKEYGTTAPYVQVLIPEDVVDKEEEDGDTVVITPKMGPPSDPVDQKAETSTSKPAIDKDVLIEENSYLLSGKHCLYGGGIGWWKYEFCYGKSVIQFHDSTEGGRVEVLLGLFNEDIHKHWIDDNSHKRPLRIDGKITQISHLYSGGEYCKEAQVHRSVEVRVRCRDSSGSPTAVVLYLLEPHTCSYVLAVESPRFCDILQTVDEYGLIKIPKDEL